MQIFLVTEMKLRPKIHETNKRLGLPCASPFVTREKNQFTEIVLNFKMLCNHKNVQLL